MAYIITIDSNSNIAKNLIQYIKTFDFVTVTDESTKKAPTKTKAKTGLKKTTFSQEVLEAAEKLKMTPAEIAEAAKKYRMTPDDYALSMVLSDEINGNISNIQFSDNWYINVLFNRTYIYKNKSYCC